MSVNDNSVFRTQDMQLSVWLKTKNIKLIETNPLAPYRVEFVFERVSTELLEEWLTTDAMAPVRSTINEYRHLRRLARQATVGVRQ